MFCLSISTGDSQPFVSPAPQLYRSGCLLLSWKLYSIAHHAICYILVMIKSFRHKGLKKFFDTGSVAGIQPHHAKRLRMQLAALDTATTIDDMNIPGFKLHALKDQDHNRWSIWVNGNWRITFEFHDGHAFILDYEDYH